MRITDINRDDFITGMRDAMLAAADSFVEEKIGRSERGWKDPELSQLFPAVDRHAGTVYDRLVEEETTAERNRQANDRMVNAAVVTSHLR